MNICHKAILFGFGLLISAQVHASLLGCRTQQNQALYQADIDSSGLQLTAQQDIEILELLDEMTQGSTNVNISTTDIELLVDFLEKKSIETLASGDKVTIKPGTSIVFSGSVSGTLTGLSGPLYDTIAELVKKSVSPLSCQFAGVMGCRQIDGSNAYQAEKSGKDLKIVFQNDLQLDDLLGDLSSDSEIDETDLEKIIDVISTHSILDVKSGDAIIVTPGTEISFTGSHTAKITGLTKGLFTIIESAISAAIQPGVCTQVLGCRVSAGKSLIQAEMKGNTLNLVAMQDITVIDLLSELPQDDVEIEESDIEKIIDGVEENNLTDIKKGDSVSIIPGTTILFSGQPPIEIPDLTAALYDTILSAVDSIITPGICK